MTDEGRRKVIQETVAAWEQETGKRETYTLTIRGERKSLPVVALRIAVPLLNPYSHRIKAQLQEDPERGLVTDDPYGEPAQNLLARLVQERHRQFTDLKASLRVEGQLEAGVITRAGLLVNANTRLVAMRELASPQRQNIRVAVLPPEISSSQQDILEIETSLQVQRELKDPYSLTNELLLIEDLALGDGSTGRGAAEIATLMRYEGSWSELPRDRKRAEREVEENLRLLTMIRHLTSLVPGVRIPITAFDAGESARERRQPLMEVARRYDAYLEREGLAVADQFAREWLFGYLSEAGAVHKARLIEPGWVEEYVVEELRDDERFGDRVDALVTAGESQQDEEEKGTEGLELLDETDAATEVSGVAPILLRMIAEARLDRGPVLVPGGESFDAGELRSIMTGAALTAIKAKERSDRDVKAAQAPSEHVRAARRDLRKATEAYQKASHAADLNRNKLLLDIKRLRKDIDALEQVIQRDLQGSVVH